MTNDKGELDVLEMLRKIRLEPDAKRVFLNMPREEQLLAILGIQAFNANELAKTQRDLETLSEVVKKNERNAVAYRRVREKREGSEEEAFDSDIPMTQKIVTTVKKRFDQIIMMAMLFYLIFGDKVEKMVNP